MPEEELKFCPKCQLSKHLTEFYPKPRSTYIDYSTKCKICFNKDNKERKLKIKSGEIKPVTRTITDYKEAKSSIRDLTQEEFDKACEMVRNYCPISVLSRFIGCSQPTTKKYIDMGLFIHKTEKIS